MDSYLASSPLSLAIFRAAELVELAGTSWEQPVLDMGCGRGEFARAAVVTQLDVGLDRDQRHVKLAARTGKYAALHVGDARQMPFDSDSFATVLSISVLEHVADPQAAIDEAFRVLKPGGVLVATIVLDQFDTCLHVARLLRQAGLSGLSKCYVRSLNRAFSHIALHPPAYWRNCLDAAGFEILTCRNVVSTTTLGWFELWLPAALPYRISAWCGHPLQGRPKWLTRWMSTLAKSIVSSSTDTGVCIYVVAKKTVDPG